nr:hypothetical protein [Friedmanniella luteola]
MDGLVSVGGVGVAAAEKVVRASHGEAHGVLGTASHQLQATVLQSEDPAVGGDVEHPVSRIDAKPVHVTDKVFTASGLV